MIQRIQSIFLFLSSASFWSLFALPIASSDSVDSHIYADLILNLKDHPGLMGLCVAGGLVSLVAIFLFNNRKLQKGLAYLAIGCSLGLAGLGYWLFSSGGSSEGTSLGAGIAMPVLSFILTILALVFISKDDKLVKSMDRLR